MWSEIWGKLRGKSVANMSHYLSMDNGVCVVMDKRAYKRGEKCYIQTGATQDFVEWNPDSFLPSFQRFFDDLGSRGRLEKIVEIQVVALPLLFMLLEGIVTEENINNAEFKEEGILIKDVAFKIGDETKVFDLMLLQEAQYPINVNYGNGPHLVD